MEGQKALRSGFRTFMALMGERKFVSSSAVGNLYGRPVACVVVGLGSTV
jgi:hypothetical protein